MDNINVKELFDRVVRRWIVLLPIVLLAFVISNLNPPKPTYMSTVGVKVELSNIQPLLNSSQEDVLKGVSSEVAYTQLLPVLNRYVYTQFASLPIQNKFTKKLNQSTPANIDKKLVYSIVEGGTPYVFINYTSGSEEEALNGAKVIREIALNDLTFNWNQGKSDRYKITAYTTTEDTVIKQSSSSLQRFMPAIAASIIALFVLLLIPIKK